MGWVKTPTETTEELFNQVISEYGEVWNGRIGDSTTPNEYFTDHLRDYYDLTLSQCTELCRMIKEYYGIYPFYYDELKKSTVH